MKKVFVESSMIRSIGYDSNSAILEIEFKSNGAIWVYYDFPENLYHEFKNCNSKGKFFLNNIKRQFPENQVR